MRPKQRIRKIYTEPDNYGKFGPFDENQARADKVNIKDLQLNIQESGKNASESKNNRNFMYKNAHFYMPNKFNKLNRKQLIKKLPDINLTPLSNLSKPIKIHHPEEKQTEGSRINKKNQTYILNSLFEILKPEEPTSTIEPEKYRQRYRSTSKKNANDSFYENEFFNIKSNTNVKNNRGPRILQNDITRLSGHNNLMRRKIVSEQKSRPKYHQESLQKLKETAFEQFKRCAMQKPESLITDKQLLEEPKQNFQNLEIITFYNKFPTVNKGEEKKQNKREQMSFQQKNNSNNRKKQSMSPNKVKIKPMYRNYQDQENEFIFQPQ